MDLLLPAGLSGGDGLPQRALGEGRGVLLTHLPFPGAPGVPSEVLMSQAEQRQGPRVCRAGVRGRPQGWSGPAPGFGSHHLSPPDHAGMPADQTT